MTVVTKESPLRVLVVDDDIDTIESTALLFKMQGHEARTARGGTDAIKQAEVFCPQLILLDIAMPKMNGYHVVRELRAIQCVEESTIVAVTGYAQPLDRRRCAEAGFDLHLAKPVDSVVLDHLALLCRNSSRLKQESDRLMSNYSHSLGSLIGVAIQMANTFLDVAVNTKNTEVKKRCLAKAQKMHRKMTELVESNVPERLDLIAALDELQWRYNRAASLTRVVMLASFIMVLCPRLDKSSSRHTSLSLQRRRISENP